MRFAVRRPGIPEASPRSHGGPRSDVDGRVHVRVAGETAGRAPDGTDHASHKEQASMIRWYIIWRNNHPYDERVRRIVNQANVG